LQNWTPGPTILPVVTGVIALFVFKPAFINGQAGWLIFLLVLFIMQVVSALSRYGFTTSFHTYLAKLAAIVQGSFLISAFSCQNR
jgi:CDP-diacylglycerol--glycerol-3-phosphate 3-phosphatidyltransferase